MIVTTCGTDEVIHELKQQMEMLEKEKEEWRAMKSLFEQSIISSSTLRSCLEWNRATYHRKDHQDKRCYDSCNKEDDCRRREDSIETPDICKEPFSLENVDGICLQMDPTAKLSDRQILWPYVSTELFSQIGANRLEAARLHLLIPPCYLQSIESHGYDDGLSKPMERLVKMLKVVPNHTKRK